MIYLIVAQFLFFTYYIVYIWSRYGVLASISDSWYTVDKGKKWMFTVLFCFVVGILQVFHAEAHALFFFSGAGLCFTGVAAAFREKMTKTVHYVGATVAIVFSILGLYLLGIQWVFYSNLLVAIFFLSLGSKIQSRLWWTEIIAFYSVLAGLLQYYLK